MLASTPIIFEIKSCAEWADRLVRADLINGFIVNENDYTSNFTSAFRREINSRDIPGISAHSQVLTPSVERKTGTDGCIIFRNKNHFKIGIFEAKWPRLSTHTNYWDSLQKNTAISHFDSQIYRQKNFTNLAIWEMFYCEEPYKANSLFPPFGSSCVWHSDAVAVSLARNQATPWSDTELTSMLRNSGNDIGSIVSSILECKQGHPLPVDSMDGQLREFGIKGEILIVNFAEDEL
jgi:hypothetical protein